MSKFKTSSKRDLQHFYKTQHLLGLLFLKSLKAGKLEHF